MSLIDLMNVKKLNNESIDDYLNRFQKMKSQCFTQISKHELVRMTQNFKCGPFTLNSQFEHVFFMDFTNYPQLESPSQPN